MEEVRLRKLDHICTSIAETRGAMNELRETEAGLEQTALSVMRSNDRTSYRHAGVELVRVPGEEKLRVRTARERTATAEVEEESEGQDDPGADLAAGEAPVGGDKLEGASGY